MEEAQVAAILSYALRAIDQDQTKGVRPSFDGTLFGAWFKGKQNTNPNRKGRTILTGLNERDRRKIKTHRTGSGID